MACSSKNESMPLGEGAFMTRGCQATTIFAALGLLLASCGDSGSKQSATSTTRDTAGAGTRAASVKPAAKQSSNRAPAPAAHEPDATIRLTSPVALVPIPKRYTCQGANMSLPLRWGAVPANTVELDVFVLRLEGQAGRLYAAWGVAGLPPRLKGLSAGRLPGRAVVGSNSMGHARYSVCPAKGSSTQYFVLLFALAHKIPAAPGFSASGLAERLLHMPLAEGMLTFGV
jgi:phosphatidylethanolamine-binding protein (PEBP) family uncharacterized protein